MKRHCRNHVETGAETARSLILLYVTHELMNITGLVALNFKALSKNFLISNNRNRHILQAILISMLRKRQTFSF